MANRKVILWKIINKQNCSIVTVIIRLVKIWINCYVILLNKLWFAAVFDVGRHGSLAPLVLGRARVTFFVSGHFWTVILCKLLKDLDLNVIYEYNKKKEEDQNSLTLTPDLLLSSLFRRSIFRKENKQNLEKPKFFLKI